MSEEGRGDRRGRRRTAVNKLRKGSFVESVIIEEPLSFSIPIDTPASLKQEAGIKDGTRLAGEGYYISATNNTSRYYGLLISKEALKAASLLHFQEEARSLDLNRRMKSLRDRQHKHGEENGAEAGDEPDAKRAKLEQNAYTSVPASIDIEPNARAIQKFQYVPGKSEEDPGYRILIATYLNARVAAEGDRDKEEAIAKACDEGGDFVSNCYYQYEGIIARLESQKAVTKATDAGMRLSMGFQSFLQDTPMPVWFPLSNLQLSQHRVLSMLQMKRNNKGGIDWDASAATETPIVHQGTHVPMEDRSHFRVGIIGGGISGLACAKELLRFAEEERINLEVVILEGRERLGGRLLTDTSTFRSCDGTNFPVDLGASWIHGIDHNPLAALANEANIDFVTASEDVKMLQGSLQPVDSSVDESMGKLFDSLLDQAADDVWDAADYVPECERSQEAIRWYADCLGNDTDSEMTFKRTDAPPHRHSSDVSIDQAIGNAISKHNHREFRKFGFQEDSLLLWNTKNIEYALGANISDLSMKFWDSDERHAFEGDHVLLKQGYSTLVHHLEKDLRNQGGEKFKCELNFTVGKVEYSRKTATAMYPRGLDGRSRHLVDLSDSCCVTSADGERSFKFDFVVCSLPLGVLKDSVDGASSERSSAVVFDPPLPFSKVDAIQNTGFGLLNKVYLQFETAFWRIPSILDGENTLFGNASGMNSHHYMFNDIGKSLGTARDMPPILMSLISGKEAAHCELMSDEEIVNQVLETLRKLFTSEMVTRPVDFRVTRWGSDKFSRGCYTFLPPGATDQDFQILQSPINGNGDSITLEGSETMRLFWAGEHTTALHPSMAHGALLSGIRAAKEVTSTICFKFNGERSGFEKLIPMAIFRKKNPNVKLQCNLCHLTGSRVREGGLLALQKGARQVLVHNNCGEYSPEVEVRDGLWKSVIKAVNRGKQISCCMCGATGATIGCTHDSCFRCFHFLCAENTGWRFERDGKIYFCDQHRTFKEHGDNECDQISVQFYRSKRSRDGLLFCRFCGESDNDSRRGLILAYAQQNEMLVVHDRCARYSTIMETLDDYTSMSDTSFKNLFEIAKQAKICVGCHREGATIVCSDTNCDCCYHFTCAEDNEGWKFEKKGIRFKCKLHRHGVAKAKAVAEDTPQMYSADKPRLPAAFFQHNLFFSGSERIANGGCVGIAKSGLAVNERTYTRPEDAEMRDSVEEDDDEDPESSDDDDRKHEPISDPFLVPLSPWHSEPDERVELTRGSIEEAWDFDFNISPDFEHERNYLLIELGQDSLRDLEMEKIDHPLVVLQIDGKEVGSQGFQTVQEILSTLRDKNYVSFSFASLLEDSI